MLPPPPKRTPRPLPPPPAIRLEIKKDRTAEAHASGGFVNIRRLDLVAHYPNGQVSTAFPYDVADRKALDAVVIVAFFTEREGRRHVYLRSAVRPPCALRTVPPAHDGLLWELPAGLVEPDEEPSECAVRELREELGFSTTAGPMQSLGPWTFPSPGLIGERHLFYTVQVDPAARERPTEDGSALEAGAAVHSIALEHALELCREGFIVDAKTELALRRFAEGT